MTSNLHFEFRNGQYLITDEDDLYLGCIWKSDDLWLFDGDNGESATLTELIEIAEFMRNPK